MIKSQTLLLTLLMKICWASPQCLKITEKVSFSKGFEILKLAVKQCYQTWQFYLDKNWWKMPKLEKPKCDILADFQTQCSILMIQLIKTMKCYYYLWSICTKKPFDDSTEDWTNLNEILSFIMSYEYSTWQT